MTKDIKAATLFGVGFVLGVTLGNWLIASIRRNV